MSRRTDLAEPPDLDLLRRAASGDRESFGALFERYQHVVYRFARSMTGSAEAAEDVTQEVFVILIRDLQRFEPERAALSTYLYGIARNVSRDRLRREGRFLSFLSDSVMRLCGSGPISPLEHLVTVERDAEVRRALSRIPLKYREVVILCDLHDLSYEEISTVLRTSIGAVRSRLHRGRHLLKQRLAAHHKAGADRLHSSARCSL